MIIEATVKRRVGGALLASLGVLMSAPTEARENRSSRFYAPPQQAPASGPERDRHRYGQAGRSQARISAEVPLPPPRPPEFAAPAQKQPEARAAAQTPTPAPSPGDDAETCAAVLAGGTVVAEGEPAIHSGLCGIEHPLMLKAVILTDKRQIKLEPPVAMRCRLAGAIAAWIIEDVAPSVAEAGAPLAALSGVGGYECRGRNNVAGAKLSEHAIGDAMDLSALKLTDGRIISVQEQKNVQLFAKIRASACQRFATVLGPGADPSHKTHLHLDLQERRHGYKMCQWDVAPPQPPIIDEASPSSDKPPDAAEKKIEDRSPPRARSSARRR